PVRVFSFTTQGSVANFGNLRSEPCVVNENTRTGVFEKVAKLLRHIPIVDVEWCGASPVRTDHAFQVLVTVGEVESDVILPGLVPGEFRPRCVTSDALGRKVDSDSVDTFVHLPVWR